MGIFKKRKDEEEKKKALEKEGEKSKRKRGKKDNLPKPWSKKERTLVLIVFLGTIIISGILALSARSWKLPNFPRLSLPKFDLFKTSVIEYEAEGTSKEEIDKAEEIVDGFKKETEKLSGVYGLYVINLENGFSFGINQNETFQAASLMKLPVIVGMYQEEESGNLDLSKEYVLKEEDKVGGAGSLYLRDEGYEISYGNLIKLMCQNSDNTAYKISAKYLGDTNIQHIIESIGMKKTNDEDNITTPKDMGILFERLWKGSLISGRNKDEMIRYLTNTDFEDHLAAGLPNDVKLTHKYGREIHVVNDAGIVLSENPFVVVIMSKGVVEKEADEIFPTLSKLIFDGMTN